jgi:B12-binding domain/radical SAM domain protein
MPKRVLVILRRTRSTKYSIASLVAALDTKLFKEPVKVVIRDSLNEIIKDIKESKEDIIIVGYSLLTTQLPLMLDEIAVLNEVKQRTQKNLITVIGGPHASGDPVGSLNLGFDYAFVNEAEETFPRFIKALIHGEDVISKVPGILTVLDRNYVFTGRPKPINLDEFPPFAYWRGLFAPIEITRGCPFGCRYCQVSVMHGAKPRHRSLENVLYYSEILLKHGRRDLRFISPNAFSYLGDGIRLNINGLCSLVEGLTDLTKRLKGRFFLGTFPSEVRPEHAAVEEAVKCIKGKVANRRIIIGAQSGSDRVLKAINRGHSVDDVIEAVEVLNKHGFEVDIDFIMGMPPEEEEDMEKSIKLMEFLTSRYKVRIHAHYYLPLPGSPFDIAEPKPIPNRIRKRLYKLLGRGKLYGDWLKQEELSKQIVSLWRKGIILGFKGWRRVKVLKLFIR